MRKLTILVTGGAGFIGSHVVDAYVAHGHRVAVVDNLASGSRHAVSARASFVKADIRDAKTMARVFKKIRPDVVNHHAALAGVTGGASDTLSVNVMGTCTLLAAATGAPKIIFASSAAVYGNGTPPLQETTPTTPLSVYGLSKMLSEECIRFFARASRLSYVIFRYANVYGPRQKNGVVPTFLARMRKNMSATLFGNGRKTRDYVFVKDVAEANVRALACRKNIVCNIATGRETEDREIFRLIARATGYRRPPRFAPPRSGEIARSALSFACARAALGWKPRFNVLQGMQETVRPQKNF